MIYSEVERRYQNDVAFRCLVDAIGGAIERMELTPSEVREAAMLACVRHELYRMPRGIEITVDAKEGALARIDSVRQWLESYDTPVERRST